MLVKIDHLRLISNASCGEHGQYPSISHHIIDIHQMIAMEIHINPYLASYNHQKSQIKPFSAKMAQKWHFLQKCDDDKCQNLDKLGQDGYISLQRNDFMP